jgi:ATP-dependent DNA ligase
VCVRLDGITSVGHGHDPARIAGGNVAALVLFVLDLLHLDGDDFGTRKARLAELLSHAGSPLQYRDHQAGHGRTFHETKPAMSLEGIVLKRARGGLCTGQ